MNPFQKREVNEPTKHFEEIWRDYNDPDVQERKKRKSKKEQKLKNNKEDLGL